LSDSGLKEVQESAMTDDRAAPIFFFAPFVSSTMRVEPAWIDYNGHMNMAFYHVLFDRAVDEGFGLVGLGPAYVRDRKASYFAVELHTIHKRELTLDDPVRITLQLIDFDDKRLHFYLEIRHAAEGWVSACCEQLALHVDLLNRKVTPFPEDILAGLGVMRAAHSRLARPAALGRTIRVPGAPQERETVYATGTRH
jgi:acyl-CoA thioester hydrolase